MEPARDFHRRIAIDLEQQFAGNYIVKRYKARGLSQDGPAIFGAHLGFNAPGRRKLRLEKDASGKPDNA